MLTILRFLLFIPAALLASYLMSRVLMLVYFINPTRGAGIPGLLLLFGATGATLGATAGAIFPFNKKISLAIVSALVSALSLLYLARFPDAKGLAASATFLISTVAGHLYGENFDFPDFKRKLSSDEPSTKVDIVPLGSKLNPIRCEGPHGEHEYLRRLRTFAGHAPSFKRRGSVARDNAKPLDAYEVEFSNEPIFFDMYHMGYIEARPCPGYFIFNAWSIMESLAPPKSGSDPDEFSRFGSRMRASIGSEAMSLSTILGANYNTDDCRSIINFTMALITYSYGNSRDRVVDAVVRNSDLKLNDLQADRVYTFISGDKSMPSPHTALPAAPPAPIKVASRAKPVQPTLASTQIITCASCRHQYSAKQAIESGTVRCPLCLAKP